MHEIILGVDPGLGGALAVVNDFNDCETCLMPTMGEGKHRIIDGTAVARFIEERDVEFAIIENVHAMPKQGVSSVFKFGQVHGQVLGVLQSRGIPYRLIAPRVWKRDMSLTADKSLSRRRAIEQFPHAQEQFSRVMDEGRAEAALLALWYIIAGRNESAA
jgi:crossover junction endodeoxyribonuclease RuvC